jgi:hypothetical protein
MVRKHWRISETIISRLLLKMIHQWMVLHFSRWPADAGAVSHDLFWW